MLYAKTENRTIRNRYNPSQLLDLFPLLSATPQCQHTKSKCLRESRAFSERCNVHTLWTLASYDYNPHLFSEVEIFAVSAHQSSKYYVWALFDPTVPLEIYDLQLAHVFAFVYLQLHLDNCRLAISAPQGLPVY